MENEILKKLDQTIVEREKLKLKVEKIENIFSDLDDWLDENMSDLIDEQSINETETGRFEIIFQTLKHEIKYS